MQLARVGMRALDPDLVERFTGQRRILSEEAALAELQPRAIALERAENNHRKMSRRLGEACRAYCTVRFRARVAAIPSNLHLESWAFVLIVATGAALLLGVSAALAFSGELVAILLITSVPFIAAVPALLWLFPTDVAVIQQRLDYWGRQRAMLYKDCAATRSAVDAVGPRYLDAKRIYDGILRAREYPLQRLLSADCRCMSGAEFESFLADVFHFLGYSVTRTGKSGDQGVDLVVERAGIRTAVQAKCYTNSVGNGAVQEAFTGRTIYGCHRCAVITSSVFTSGARQAAFSTGCILISGDQIPLLIRGQIEV